MLSLVLLNEVKQDEFSEKITNQDSVCASLFQSCPKSLQSPQRFLGHRACSCPWGYAVMLMNCISLFTESPDQGEHVT